MGWATFAIEKLQKGETVQVRPGGHSMTGRVNHKDRVTLARFLIGSNRSRINGCLSHFVICRLAVGHATLGGKHAITGP